MCLYRGCIPSKALLHIADVINEAKHASSWGVTFEAPRIDVEKVRGFKDRVVTQLTGSHPIVAELIAQKKVKIVGAVYSLDTGKVDWLPVAK